MQSRTGGRRAAPPRPTLLVGDLAACHAAFERLQQRVLELSLQQQAVVEAEENSRSVEAWRDLVPRCRALRETLTSLRELSHFTRQVYECAADVCCRAGDYPEALKALQQLVHRIYPALAAQHAQQQQESAAGPPHMQAARASPPGLTLHNPAADGMESNGGGSRRPAMAGAAAGMSPARAAATGGGGAVAAASGQGAVGDEEDEAPALELDDGTLAAALAGPHFQRWPEAAAALALYFACVVHGGADRLDTPATLRALPCRLVATPEVALALRLRSALAAGDFVSLFRLRVGAPPLVRLVADAAAGRAREAALATLAAAYRNIAVAAVCRMLHLDAGGRQLMGCLHVLTGRGHVAAQRALGGLQQEERPAAADLVFKG